MNFIKVFFNKNVISAIVSAIGAVVSAFCAGCKLSCGEMSVKDFGCEVFNQYHSSTNSL